MNRRSLLGFLAAAPVAGAALLKLGPLVETGALVRTDGVGMAGSLDGVRGGFILTSVQGHTASIIGEAGPEIILPAEIFTINSDLLIQGSIVADKLSTEHML